MKEITINLILPSGKDCKFSEDGSWCQFENYNISDGQYFCFLFNQMLPDDRACKCIKCLSITEVK